MPGLATYSSCGVWAVDEPPVWWSNFRFVFLNESWCIRLTCLRGIFYWCLVFIIVFIQCPNVTFIIPLIWFHSEIAFLFQVLSIIIFHRRSLYSFFVLIYRTICGSIEMTNWVWNKCLVWIDKLISLSITFLFESPGTPSLKKFPHDSHIDVHCCHYSDVIWMRWRLKSPASRLFTQ